MSEPALPTPTVRLQFSALAADDSPFILELVNEPGWLQHIGDRNVHDLESATAYISKGPAASYAKHGFGLYRVNLVSTGETIGLCGLIKRDALGQPDVGYAFLQRHSGQGYATEAAAAVLAFAQQALGLNQLLAITSLDNHASIRVLEKIGFRYQRLLEDAALGSSKVFVWRP